MGFKNSLRTLINIKKEKRILISTKNQISSNSQIKASLKEKGSINYESF